MGRWFGRDDYTRADRVRYLAGEQQAGRGQVISCRLCGGDGADREDPSDDCPACRGTGAAIDDTGRGVLAMGPYGDSDWAAEQFRLVLGHLRWHWGDAYEIGVAGGLWYAVRRDGRGKLEEGTSEGLRDAILA